MRRGLLAGMAALLAVNGLAMLLWPQLWYQLVPTVPFTGPFNGHFVRDIGCAYLASAAGLAWFAADPSRARPAALIALFFLLAHAATHVWDTLAGRCTPQHLVQDFAGVFLLPLLALALVVLPGPGHRSVSLRSQGESSC